MLRRLFTTRLRFTLAGVIFRALAGPYSPSYIKEKRGTSLCASALGSVQVEVAALQSQGCSQQG